MLLPPPPPPEERRERALCGVTIPRLRLDRGMDDADEGPLLPVPGARSAMGLDVRSLSMSSRFSAPPPPAPPAHQLKSKSKAKFVMLARVGGILRGCYLW